MNATLRPNLLQLFASFDVISSEFFKHVAKCTWSTLNKLDINKYLLFYEDKIFSERHFGLAFVIYLDVS